MRFARTGGAAAALVLACAALAGGGPVPFAYLNETATRLASAPSLGVSDVAEKCYAWGDVDKDGWTDLVVVRK